MPKFSLRFTNSVAVKSYQGSVEELIDDIHGYVKKHLEDSDFRLDLKVNCLAYITIWRNKQSIYSLTLQDGKIFIGNSVLIKNGHEPDSGRAKDIEVSWSYKEENLGSHVLELVEKFF